MPQNSPRSVFHQRLHLQAVGTEKISRTSEKLLDEAQHLGTVAETFGGKISEATEKLVTKTGEIGVEAKQIGIHISEIKTELANIGAAIGNLGTTVGDEVFVGDFFLKALMGAGPGALSARDPVGKVFCTAGLHDLGCIHEITCFKTTKASAEQLFNKLAEAKLLTPPTPTLGECKALLRALNNIFGEEPPTPGSAGPTTSAAE
jgi:hypothetical protein